jgi:hypothetical protein
VDPKSPLLHRVQVAAQDDRVLDDAAKARHQEWSISTATIVEAIMRLISSNPKADRDLLHRSGVGSGRVRSKLREQSKPMPKAPLRELYLDVRDIVIYGLVINYLRAADAVFWKHPSPGFIRKTIGIQALFDVLADLLPDQLATKDLTEKAWLGWLTRAAKIDFSDRLFNASGSGRGRVKNALLISMARRTLDDVSPELRADFRRVLGLS